MLTLVCRHWLNGFVPLSYINQLTYKIMTSYKRQELRSEYESTYLAYVKGTDYLTFAEWLVKYKGYAPRKPKDTRKNRKI